MSDLEQQRCCIGWQGLLILIAILAAPIADLFVSFGPPWPSMYAALLAAVASEVLAIVCSWPLARYWYQGVERAGQNLRVLGTVVLLTSIVIYISLASKYIRTIYQPRDREIIGGQYKNEDMAQFVSGNPTKYTPVELIKQFHDVEAIWSQDSLTANRRRLLLSYCLGWAGVGLIASGVLVAQRKTGQRSCVATGGLQETSTTATDPTVQEVILLIHGIRTQAEWQDMVVDVLGQIPNTKPVPFKYEFRDALSFWLPFVTRSQIIEEIRWRIRHARHLYPQARLSVIAHSFGTYAIGNILMSDADVTLHRLVLCGSVLPRGFRWDQISHRVETEVINDCGTHDKWPVFAQFSSWGYGASGTFGFGSPGVRDRNHKIDHSDFFRRKFVATFWLPWFASGIFEPGVTATRRPYCWSFMTVVTIPRILGAAIFGGLLWYFSR